VVTSAGEALKKKRYLVQLAVVVAHVTNVIIVVHKNTGTAHRRRPVQCDDGTSHRVVQDKVGSANGIRTRVSAFRGRITLGGIALKTGQLIQRTMHNA
jgi:hypothetical protein